jgi:hypothetical protein
MFRSCINIVQCLTLYRTHEIWAAVLEILLVCFAAHIGLSRIWLLCSLTVDFRLFYSISNLAAGLALYGEGTGLLFVSDNSLWELNTFPAGTVTCNQIFATLCVFFWRVPKLVKRDYCFRYISLSVLSICPHEITRLPLDRLS